MKTQIMMVAMLVGAANAQADGFVCTTADGSLNVKMFNHTNPEEGTRSAAVMVLSDPSVSEGRKTIARFSDANETLSSESARYEADVDLRYNDSARKGELILGTKLGMLETIVATIHFSYANPVEDGDVVRGSLKLVKRNGDIIREALECERYLKN